MILFDNLVIQNDTIVILFNVYTFRRKVILRSELSLLADAYRMKLNNMPLTQDMSECINDLELEGQIISKDIIESIEGTITKVVPVTNFTVPVLTLEFSYRCNLNCTYCYQRKFKKNIHNLRMHRFHIERIKGYIDWMHGNSTESSRSPMVVLSGGEPLLWENIDIIEETVRQFDSSKMAIKTNGLNIVPMKNVIDYQRFETVQVSLDGTESIHFSQAFQGRTPFPGMYQRIVEGILLLLEMGINVVIACVVNRNSYLQLPAFFSYLKEIGILDHPKSKLILNPVYDRNSTNELDNDFNTESDVIQYARFIREYAPDMVRSCHWFSSFSRLRHLLQRMPNEPTTHHINKCAPEDGIPLVFSPNGKVYFCSCTNTSRGVLGEYYANYEFDRSTYTQIVTRTIFDEPKCKGCPYRYLCGTGCFMNKVITESGSIEPFCGAFSSELLLNHIGDILL